MINTDLTENKLFARQYIINWLSYAENLTGVQLQLKPQEMDLQFSWWNKSNGKSNVIIREKALEPCVTEERTYVLTILHKNSYI